jgi:Tfp pilus assembly protein PilF
MFRRVVVSIAFLVVSACSTVADKHAGEVKPAAVQPDAEVLITAADATRLEGRLTEAVQIYQQILVGDPNSVQAQYGMAECLFALGKPRDARTIFAGLTKDPQLGAAARQGVGLADLALNKRESAAESLHQAVAADPSLWRALNGLALIADLQHRADEAGELYGKALAINPDSTVLLNNRGYSRLIAGHPDEAIADFRRAIVLDPESETIENNFRLAIAAKGNYTEATRNVPRDRMPVVLNNVGFMAMRRGDLVAADGLFARALAENPNYDLVTSHNLDELAALKGADK